MPPKHKIRPIPMDHPPNTSSSEEQLSYEQDLSSDSEKEQNVSPAPKTQSESETKSDTVPAKVKPLASKPKAQAQKVQKPKAQPSPAPSKSASKRPAAEVTNGTDSKRAKKKSSTTSADEKTKDDEKKTPRRWSEDEELAILKGMLDFTSKTKQDALKIPNAFHDFMTKLPDWEEVSKDQLRAKIRSLKRKFDTVAAKEENGESLNFAKPHDQKVFELSKKAWGAKPIEVVEKPKSNGIVAKSPKKKETGKVAASAKKPKPENKKETKSEAVPVPVPVSNEAEKMELDHNKVDSGSVGFLSRELSRYKEAVQLDEDEVKRGLELIGESKRVELEQRWKALRFAEIKLLAERSVLIAEQTKLMIDAIKSSDDYDSK